MSDATNLPAVQGEGGELDTGGGYYGDGGPKGSTPSQPVATPKPAGSGEYRDFELPPGTTVDKEGLEAFTALARDARLTQEQAQRFLDLGVKREQAAAARQLQAFVDLQTRWVSEIKSDAEIGGSRLDETRNTCAQAITRLAIPGLREALDLTGAGNSPAVVKLMVRVGQMLGVRPAPQASGYYGAGGPKQ